MSTTTSGILIFNHLEISPFHLVWKDMSPFLRDSGSESVEEVMRDKN